MILGSNLHFNAKIRRFLTVKNPPHPVEPRKILVFFLLDFDLCFLNSNAEKLLRLGWQPFSK